MDTWLTEDALDMSSILYPKKVNKKSDTIGQLSPHEDGTPLKRKFNRGQNNVEYVPFCDADVYEDDTPAIRKGEDYSLIFTWNFICNTFFSS